MRSPQLSQWARQPVRRQKRWTIRELNQLRAFADEGLSLRRAAVAMERTEGAVIQAAFRYRVRFHGESGAPFGNTNAKGYKIRDEAERAQHRRNMAKWRKRRQRARQAEAAD